MHQKHAKGACFAGTKCSTSPVISGARWIAGDPPRGLNIADILTQALYFMELLPDDLKRLAQLARISVSDSDITSLQTHLNGIFGLIDELQAVDTTGVEPLSHPLDVVNPMSQRLREDQVTELDCRSANLANAPAQENGLFVVPRVIE